MKFKIKVLLFVESVINKITRPLGLRVILIQNSALHDSSISFRADGLVTSHACNFLDDPKFQETIAFVRQQVAHPVYHEFRIYNATRLAAYAARVSNSMFVECGVGEGILTLSILKYHELIGGEGHNFLSRTPIVLVDTYEGIDPRHVSDEEIKLWGTSAEEHSRQAIDRSYRTSSFDRVANRFKAYANVELLKGSVPDVLLQNEQRFGNISYLHIDMNNAKPESEALKILYDKMTVPGFVLFDDYGFKGMYLQKAAVDGACVELGIDLPMSLPTGQGLIIKTAQRH